MPTPNLLWQPDPERIAAANITAFARHLSERTGVALPDYEALWRSSIDRREEFWRAVWDFCGVIGERGARTLIDPEKMPGAKWFPDARINYAENLLARDIEPGEADALVFRGEDKMARRVSNAELVAATSRVAGALKAHGRRGRRSRRRLPPEHARGHRRDAAASEPRRDLVVVLARLRRARRARPLRPDRAARAVRRRRLLVRRQGAPIPRHASPRSSRRCHRSSASSSSPTCAIPAAAGRAAPIRGAVTWGEFLALHRARPLAFARLPFDHPLYILYSSGTTGVPKCIVHGAGGTLLQHLKEHRLHSDLKPGDRLFYFTTCGWMMWNWLCQRPRRRRDAGALRRLALPPRRNARSGTSPRRSGSRISAPRPSTSTRCSKAGVDAVRGRTS